MTSHSQLQFWKSSIPSVDVTSGTLAATLTLITAIVISVIIPFGWAITVWSGYYLAFTTVNLSVFIIALLFGFTVSDLLVGPLVSFAVGTGLGIFVSISCPIQGLCVTPTALLVLGAMYVASVFYFFPLFIGALIRRLTHK